LLLILPVIKRSRFFDYSYETEGLTIELLMEKGFSVSEALAWLSKNNIKKISENDNGCRNDLFNPSLRMPPDRMKRFRNKKGVK